MRPATPRARVGAVRATTMALVGGAALLAAVPSLRAAGSDNESFMPRGGRTLLVEMLGADARATQWQAVATARRNEAQWTEFVAARAAQASEREKATLVAYLDVNMPLAKMPAALPAGLPRDGRDLAWQQCQFCHSLFSSHLTQARDLQGWRNIFLSPFHRELKMTPQEREEFARYSALNMPMRVDDVPPELRF